MGVFIKGIGNISPQNTIDKDAFFNNASLPISSNRLKCIEPDYTQFVDVKQLRRMSRVIKMSVASSFSALRESNLEIPDAVIVGTALGCLEDTATFLTKLVQNDEDMLSPTAFIYSTHNTIAGQIAYLLQCKGYNSTYVHRNISFESALIDASLLIHEGSVKNVLVGGVDELTEASFKIFDRLGYYKNEEELAGSELYTTKSKGSIAGEGAAFFTLLNANDGACYAELLDVETISFSTTDEVLQKGRQLLTNHGLSKPDLIIAGYNGDKHDDIIFDTVIDGLKLQNQTLKFKHLSGEFGTATGFATWLAALILKNNKIPLAFESHMIENKEVKSILIYNQYQNQHHSFILLKSC